MSRCGCSGSTCSCIIQGGGGVSVSGAGSVSNPYLITSSINFAVTDTSTVNLTLTGSGSVADPWNISAAATVTLDDLTDVIVNTATTGQVLAKQADGTWKPAAASTASPGTVNVSSTLGLQGDATAGNPLGIKLAPSSGLVVDATGLKVSGGGAWTAYTPTLTGSTTNPTIGNGSITGHYSQNGKSVDFRIVLTIGSTTTRGVGAWSFSLPVADNAAVKQVVAATVSASGLADYAGVAKLEGISKVTRVFLATSTAAQALGHSVPSSLAAGSQIIVQGTYEAA
jgi:hypothetical protein